MPCSRLITAVVLGKKKPSKNERHVWKANAERQLALSRKERYAGVKEERKNPKIYTAEGGGKMQLGRDLIDNGLDNVK